MNLIYAQQNKEILGKSVFLAGPTPRSIDIKSWRNDAIKIFKELNFQGTICIPEMENEVNKDFEYEEQIEWEEKYLNKSDIIMFWIPRDLKTLPGFTTNIEFGFWLAKNPSKIVLGIPENTPKSDYLIYYSNKLNIPLKRTLEETIKEVLKCVEN